MEPMLYFTHSLFKEVLGARHLAGRRSYPLRYSEVLERGPCSCLTCCLRLIIGWRQGALSPFSPCSPLFFLPFPHLASFIHSSPIEAINLLFATLLQASFPSFKRSLYKPWRPQRWTTRPRTAIVMKVRSPSSYASLPILLDLSELQLTWRARH